MNYFPPLQVHQYPDIGPTDQSYLISMSLCSSPLMDALLACAALTFRPYSKVWQSFAIERYNRSVHDICLGIDDGSFTGEEDCLLATTMWLCVFEVSETWLHSTFPSIANERRIHVLKANVQQVLYT